MAEEREDERAVAAHRGEPAAFWSGGQLCEKDGLGNLTAAGVSEEEEVLGSTEEEETAVTPDGAGQQGIFNPVEETRTAATLVRSVEVAEERLGGLTTDCSTDRRQVDCHKLRRPPGLLDGCQAAVLERTPANAAGGSPKEKFDGVGSGILESVACEASLNTVKLEGQEAINSSYIAIEENEEEECQNRARLDGHSKSLEKCVLLPKSVELRSENDAQSAPARTENLHQVPTSSLKMTQTENEPLSPLGIMMVAEDEEAQSAPASPMKVVPGLAAGSPVKVPLPASDPISSVNMAGAEHSRSALSKDSNVKEMKKGLLVPSGSVKPAAEKEEEEEEAEMAPGSPVNYESHLNVSEEEREVTPMTSVAPAASTFAHPMKTAIAKDQMPTSHLEFTPKRQDSKGSVCLLKVESKNSDLQMPKQGTKEMVMQGFSNFMGDKSLKEPLQTPRQSGYSYLQTDLGSKKLTAEGRVLLTPCSSIELGSDVETVSFQSNLKMMKEDGNVPEVPISPEKTGALKLTKISVATAKSHALEAQHDTKKNPVPENPVALASPQKLSVGSELGNTADLFNRSAEVAPQHVLASPKKQTETTFSRALASPHRVLEKEHALQSLWSCKDEREQGTAISPKKRPAGEGSEGHARTKKNAVEKVPEVPVSPNRETVHTLQPSDTFQSRVPMEAPVGSSEEVVKAKPQYKIFPKKQPIEASKVLYKMNKHTMEEGGNAFPGLRKSTVEAELEMLNSHMTTEDDQEAESAPENVTVCDELAATASSQNRTVKSLPDSSVSSQKLVFDLKADVVVGVTSGLQKKVAEGSLLVKAIPGKQMIVGNFKTPLLPEKQEVGNLTDFTSLERQVTEEDPLVPFVSEEQAEEGPVALSVSEERAPEASPLVTSVSEDGRQILHGSLNSVHVKEIEESLKAVADGTQTWDVQTLPEADTTEEQEDCAQEYPGSPMDLDDDESANTSENLLVGNTGSVIQTGQGIHATSDITINQQQSVVTEVCNGTDPGTVTSNFTTYLNHGATLYPGIETDDGSFPYSVEFEKHWKATQDNPFDFTAWTDLLEYVEKENNIVASRKAYNAFFTRYPYCYGYWKKYADMERRFGYLKEAEQVYEQGVQSIPLSIDLWIHFITFLQETADMTQIEPLQRISNVFEMALAAAGMDFHSDKLWEMYVEWAKAQGDLQAITVIYDRVLSTPTQLYSHHFEKFKEHVSSNSPVDILSKEEYLWLKSKLVPEAASASASANMESGEQVHGHEGSEEAAQVAETDNQSDVDVQKMRELIISLREQLYKQNEAEVSRRWTFEEAIKRPYFHVKPLERAQLINWRDYLDFEISSGSHARTIVLFERCVIACALYEEFWLKYAKYLENHTVVGTRSVFQRSCLYHLPRKPNLHLLWAAFEEKQGDVQEARNILKRLEEAVPGLAMVRLRRVSLERRFGNLEAAEALLREAIMMNEGTPLATFYSIKLARQALKVQNNLSKAREVLQEALEKDPENAKLYLNLLEMEFSADVKNNERNTINCIERVLSSSLPADTKVVFSQRRMEFLEDFGSSIKSLLTAYDEHQKLLKLHAPKRKSIENGIADEPEEKKSKSEEITAQPVITAETSTTLMGGGMSTSEVAGSAAYDYNTWYQNYGAYNYQNAWNFNYYPQS
ncbi:hypothetical protein NDU88_003307 [Pleurodeles waltl]|uniref:Pre-mRNA-processing factor 39 n=1 Tax=Pleurodeles waltl TaxID=8319 RepID=A0AAV7MTW4_PLEWA|nr:hypothetical protein NDU88_003307 [Pleurodeles waltl]